jgi:hypothetical protein
VEAVSDACESQCEHFVPSRPKCPADSFPAPTAMPSPIKPEHMQTCITSPDRLILKLSIGLPNPRSYRDRSLAGGPVLHLFPRELPRVGRTRFDLPAGTRRPRLDHGLLGKRHVADTHVESHSGMRPAGVPYLTVTTPSDSPVCKIKSRVLHAGIAPAFRSRPRLRCVRRLETTCTCSGRRPCDLCTPGRDAFPGRVGYFNIAGFNELKEDGTARAT